ncbi:hypothetical protein [uncultured Microbulbifer sp.]|uniref:hypothetical protein n=1 Tax=uncultured Microbulbifer sp. TaxID=348147 RepID=UPI0025E2D61B|nr:hypothetical protein [uncultured Microbulbifer sp.]
MISALLLVACGSGGSSGGGGSNSSGGGSSGGGRSAPPPAEETVRCETSDEDSDSDQCGRLLFALTGDEGDFLQYRVRIASLSLRRDDGTRVELLPESRLVEFTDYNELAAAATLPVGRYESFELVLDYSDAEILLQVAGEVRRVVVVDAAGEAVEEVSVRVHLDGDNPLVVDSAVPAALTLAFDLASSHVVNPVDVGVVRVALFPVLVAEVDPLPAVAFVFRGPLLSVDEAANSYRIAVRPNYWLAGRFGGLDVLTGADTVWHINGETYIGAAGLRVLAEQDPGIETFASGRFKRFERLFVADTVLVGDSIPGINLDGVTGHVLSRTDDDRIFIQGARLWLTGLEPVYRDIVQVQLDRTTRVVDARFPEERFSIDRISIGQRVRILGQWDEESEIIEARRAHLQPTRLTVITEEFDPRTLDALLVAFGRWPAGWFNYRGTGSDEDSDADPNRYEINVADIDIAPQPLEDNLPLAMWGYVSPFGSAPPDFFAHALNDFSEFGARLLVNWVPASAVPFNQIDPIGLILNPDAGFGIFHDLRRAALVTDILEFDELPVIEPLPDDGERGIYSIVHRGYGTADIVLYSSFSSFAADLSLRINRGATVRRLHARGGYVRDRNRFVARGLSVLLQPVEDTGN